jgi:general secretion pathway protein J
MRPLRQPRQLRRRLGFTLIEVLVALSLLALLIVTLAGGLRLGTRAWESARIGASLDDADLMARALAGQLQRVFPAKLRRADGPPIIAFDGGPDWCRFVGLSEGTANWGGLMTTEIGRDGARGLDAWTRVFREDDFGAAREAMRATALSDHLEQLSFAYFGVAGPDQPPQWRDDWRGATTPPMLVRLRIRLRGPRGPVESVATISLPMQ